MKFVHAADLHIDSPLRGLPAYEGAPVARVRQATRRAFSNLIDLCLAERADLLLLGGDLFDGDWKDYSTGLFFVKELLRLRDGGVRVLLVRGNHDAASEVTRQLRLPDHAHLFSDARAETVVFDALGVAVHGLSFGARSVPSSLVPHYPPPVDGLFNIGLLHTSADGRIGHHPYAPCRVEELVQKGYDYWALGHVHAAEVVHERPWIVFPGNTQGRHIHEAGEKGCTVVTVTGDAVALRRQPLDVLRWQRIDLHLDEGDTLPRAYERAQAALQAAYAQAEGRLLAVRLRVAGGCAAHEAIARRPDAVIAELRALTFQFGEELWLEKIELKTRPPVRLDELRRAPGFVGELFATVAQAASDRALLGGLAEELHAVREKLAAELPHLDVALAPDELVELLPEVEGLLAARLTLTDRP